MSDAREVVQPRWKRRATEIADAIGGGTSSVTLSSQSINDMKQAFKEALYGTSAEQLAAGYQYCNSMMEVNLRSHPLSYAQQGGHLLVNTSSHPSDPGRFKPIAVTGNTLGITGLPANSTSLPVHLMGIDQSTGLVNPSLAGTPALRVNVMNQNAIQTSVAGHVQVKPAVDPSNSNNIFPLRVEVDELPRYTNGNTKPVPIMSGSNFAGAVQELKVREQNLAGTVGNGIKTTETAPVTSVSVSGTVAVSTITGSVAVQPALDANNVAIPLSVTETNPVSGGGTTTGVQQVKIVGDETYGIIMTKNFYDAFNVGGLVNFSPGDYNSAGFGLGAYTGSTAQQNQTLSANYSDGWTIRVNGVDIHNQDITHGLRGTIPVPFTSMTGNSSQRNAQQASTYPLFIQIDSQAIADKYHGRKVTLSSVANVWIVDPEPIGDIGNIIWAIGANTDINKWSIVIDGEQSPYTYYVRHPNGASATTSERGALAGHKVHRYNSVTWQLMQILN